MAIVLDKASLGTAVSSSGTTVAFTTTQTVASGGFITLAVGWFGVITLSSVAGGSLTWAVDKQARISGDNGNVAIVSAQAPSGLASSTTITATFSAGAVDLMIGGTSFTGVATSSPLDGTPAGGFSASTTAWSTGNVAISAGSVLVGASWAGSFDASNLSTASAGSTEGFDATTDGTGVTLAYRIEPSSGSYAVAGTWSGSSGPENVAIAAAYLATGGGGGGTIDKKLAAQGVG
jgi:hypothetical protein